MRRSTAPSGTESQRQPRRQPRCTWTTPSRTTVAKSSAAYSDDPNGYGRPGPGHRVSRGLAGSLLAQVPDLGQVRPLAAGAGVRPGFLAGIGQPPPPLGLGV